MTPEEFNDLARRRSEMLDSHEKDCDRLRCDCCICFCGFAEYRLADLKDDIYDAAPELFDALRQAWAERDEAIDALDAATVRLREERDAAIKERDEARAERNRLRDALDATHARLQDTLNATPLDSPSGTASGFDYEERRRRGTTLRDAITDTPNPEK